MQGHQSTTLTGGKQERPRFHAGTTGFFAVEDKVRAKHLLGKNPLLGKRTRNSDFTRVFSGYYPILERFDPVHFPPQKRGTLFLQSFLLAQQFGFLDRIIIPLNNRVEK